MAGKSLKLPYTPQLPPQTGDPAATRWMYAELNRIATALVPNPVSLSLYNPVDTLPIGPAPGVWTNMFDPGTIPTHDVPGGSWDVPIASQWTCPQEGFYTLAAQLSVEPFGIGNKQYYVGIRVVIDGGLPPQVKMYEITDGGDDNTPLGASINVTTVLYQGDIVYFEDTAVHENQTGTVTAQKQASILNVGSAG